MAWRNQGMTGSNNIPLGTRRRFGSGEGSSTPNGDAGFNHSPVSNDIADSNYKRGRSPVRGECRLCPSVLPS